MNEEVVIGIDPGSLRCGYAVVKLSNQAITPLLYGTISLSGKEEFSKRVKRLFLELKEIVSAAGASTLIVETQFVAINPKTTMKLSMIRGVVTLVGALYDLEIFEYSPSEIKRAISGFGLAQKNDVIEMVARVCGVRKESLSADSADAMAACICYFHRRKVYRSLAHAKL